MNEQIKSKLETGYGFRDTLMGNHELSGQQADMTFHTVATKIAAKMEISTDAARRILDSTIGRHLADAMSDPADVNGAAERLIKWSMGAGFRRSFKAVIETTDEEFYA